jgi:hypothetical protein
VLFSVGVAIVGCAIDGWAPHQAQNEGQVCFEPVTGDDGTKLMLVSVQLDQCLSSVCTRRQQMSCEALLKGRELVIKSSFRWEASTDEELDCTGDCAPPVATCAMPVLEPDEYSVHHERTTKLVWPPPVDPDPRSAVTCL